MRNVNMTQCHSSVPYESPSTPPLFMTSIPSALHTVVLGIICIFPKCRPCWIDWMLDDPNGLLTMLDYWMPD